MKRDFKALDAAIVLAIGQGTSTFRGLCSHQEVRPTADASDPKSHDGYRMIDRRLQALRKAGAIRQRRYGVWEVVE